MRLKIQNLPTQQSLRIDSAYADLVSFRDISGFKKFYSNLIAQKLVQDLGNKKFNLRLRLKSFAIHLTSSSANHQPMTSGTKCCIDRYYSSCPRPFKSCQGWLPSSGWSPESNSRDSESQPISIFEVSELNVKAASQDITLSPSLILFNCAYHNPCLIH